MGTHTEGGVSRTAFKFTPSRRNYRAAFHLGREMVQITAGKELACEKRGTDRYGRAVAACSADGTDAWDRLASMAATVLR